MARQAKTARSKTQASTRRQKTAPADAVEEGIVAFAEELGRIVGTLQARAEAWSNPRVIGDQLARIRHGAADLVGHFAQGLSHGHRETSEAAPPARGRTPPARPPMKTTKTVNRRAGGTKAAPKTRRRSPG
jgi:hypothetical protein